MAFAPSRRRRLPRRAPDGVDLTAMMDMMTIILLFLLQTWALTGSLMRPTLEALPRSSADEPPRRHLSLLLTREGLFEDVPGFARMEPAERRRHRIVPPAALGEADRVALPRLEDYLGRRHRLELDLGKAVLSRTVTVQAERTVPYAWVLKLVDAATRSGYDLFEFVVLHDEGGAP